MRLPVPYAPPLLRVVLLQQLTKHVGVLRWMPHEKHCAKTRAECCLRFGHATFGAGHFRGVSRQEVIHRLFGRELRDGRQHAECIGREKYDVQRMSTASAWHVILDVVQRIRRTRILGDALIRKIDRAIGLIEHNVFENRAEHLRGLINIRLCFGREIDDLRVAAAFEVEGAVW